MIITKQQSKRLRYICGTVGYNHPCVKKYTGGPEGKIRQIGKFKYIERENELVYFEYDGAIASLSNYEAEGFLSALMDDSGFHLGGGTHIEDLPSPGASDHNDIVDAVEHQVHMDVPPEDEDHEVNILAEGHPATDDWMDADGNDPDSLDQGTADIPERLAEENIPPTVDTPTEVTPVKMMAPPVKTPRQMSPEELTEDVIREISMTAAAREAARLHQIGYMTLPDVPSQDIIRANAIIPGFLDDYGKCLKKVGMAPTLAEIAKALPAQADWIFR